MFGPPAGRARFVGAPWTARPLDRGPRSRAAGGAGRRARRGADRAPAVARPARQPPDPGPGREISRGSWERRPRVGRKTAGVVPVRRARRGGVGVVRLRGVAFGRVAGWRSRARSADVARHRVPCGVSGSRARFACGRRGSAVVVPDSTDMAAQGDGCAGASSSGTPRTCRWRWLEERGGRRRFGRWRPRCPRWWRKARCAVSGPELGVPCVPSRSPTVDRLKDLSIISAPCLILITIQIR